MTKRKPATIQIQPYLSEEQVGRIRELVGELIDAQVALSWKGAGDPSDIEILETEAELARLKLYHYLDQLIKL